MDQVATQHKELANGRWEKMPFHLQMGNIGSEVGRAIRWREKGKAARMEAAAFRALELFDLSIDAAVKCEKPHGRLKELCRAREEFCDLIFGENEFNSNERIMRYYDQFATMKKY